MYTHKHAQIIIRQFWRALLLACAIGFMPTGQASATCLGINCTCSISADPLDFASYNPLNSTNIDAVGNVSVTCGGLLAGLTISYEVTLSTGTSSDALNRTMSNGGDTLDYNLYTDSNHASVWGDGTGGTATITNSYLLSLLSSRTDDHPVYGRVPSGQNVHVGTYTDAIVATVIF